MQALFDQRIIFEIGCNDATLLTTIAQKHPTTAFIGIDWKFRALHAAAEKIAAAGLSNVALLHGRAQEISRIFADGEIDEIWVFHPDPCDKPKELPNRLMNESFLANAWRVLAGESLLILKTDHQAYYQSVLALFEAPGATLERKFEILARSCDYWSDESVRSSAAQRLFAYEQTFFERRFTRKRRPIYYLELKRR